MSLRTFGLASVDASFAILLERDGFKMFRVHAPPVSTRGSVRARRVIAVAGVVQHKAVGNRPHKVFVKRAVQQAASATYLRGAIIAAGGGTRPDPTAVFVDYQAGLNSGESSIVDHN